MQRNDPCRFGILWIYGIPFSQTLHLRMRFAGCSSKMMGKWDDWLKWDGFEAEWLRSDFSWVKKRKKKEKKIWGGAKREVVCCKREGRYFCGWVVDMFFFHTSYSFILKEWFPRKEKTGREGRWGLGKRQ